MPTPLRIIIGFSRGSASHDVARVIAPWLAAGLGRPVELDFVPGDSGGVAARQIATATPGSNMLMMATLGTHALMPAIHPDRGYHPLNDFTPLSLLLEAPLILVASRASGIGDLSALIDKARASETPFTYGSSAIGGAPHVAAALFAHRAGIALRHVRYSDTRQLYADLVNGTIDLSFNNLMSLLPLVRGNKVIAIGTTGRTPHPALPDIVPIANAGLPGYTIANWVGIVGPPGLDPAFIAAVAAALKNSASPSAGGKSDPEIAPGSADDFKAHLEREWRFWPPVLRDLDLREG